MDADTSAHRRRLGALRGHLVANAARSSAVSARGGAPLADQLQALLDHDSHDERRRMKEFMASDPLFVPKWNVGLHEERELALRKLKRLCDSKQFGNQRLPHQPDADIRCPRVCGFGGRLHGHEDDGAV